MHCPVFRVGGAESHASRPENENEGIGVKSTERRIWHDDERRGNSGRLANAALCCKAKFKLCVKFVGAYGARSRRDKRAPRMNLFLKASWHLRALNIEDLYDTNINISGWKTNVAQTSQVG